MDSVKQHSTARLVRHCRAVEDMVYHRPTMPRLALGLLAGVFYGALSAASMLPLQMRRPSHPAATA